MLPAQAGVEGTEDLPVVVFAAVLTTILLFASGFPIFKKRLAAQPDPPEEASISAEATPGEPPGGTAEEPSTEKVEMPVAVEEPLREDQRSEEKEDEKPK
jgi:hypothetical protein